VGAVRDDPVTAEGDRKLRYSTARFCAEVTMRRICGVAVVLLLAFVAFDSPASAQTTNRERGFQLGQNYPNPFNPETKIPFCLTESLFDEGKPVRVTLEIFTTLMQRVAVPTALNHPGGDGSRVQNLEYPAPACYEAYWDGKDREGNKVASGIYIYQLVVNGRRQMQKMVVAN
jgi:hypothetical protein